MDSKLRCAHCNDVIGVYEPMVALVDGGASRTSRAAEAGHVGGAERGATRRDCYHLVCFERLHGGVDGASE